MFICFLHFQTCFIIPGRAASPLKSTPMASFTHQPVYRETHPQSMKTIISCSSALTSPPLSLPLFFTSFTFFYKVTIIHDTCMNEVMQYSTVVADVIIPKAENNKVCFPGLLTCSRESEHQRMCQPHAGFRQLEIRHHDAGQRSAAA